MKKNTITLLLGLAVSSLANVTYAQGEAVEVIPVNSPPNITEQASSIPSGNQAGTQAGSSDDIEDTRVAAVEVEQPQGNEAADPSIEGVDAAGTQVAGFINDGGQAAAGGQAGGQAGDANSGQDNQEEDANEVVSPIEEEEGGFLIKDANINDIFQLLAKRAGKQYFHNNKLNSEDFKVTGHLNGDVSALKQMHELGFQYGLKMYVKGDTIYAMLNEQLNNLPAKEWTYTLNYLRPTDIEQIKALITPMLTPNRGIVNYEPKTNTIIVIDTMSHIEMVESLLKKIDKPKGQIVVEVKILRVNSSAGQQQGVDWSASLGESGIPLEMTHSLNSVFGFPSKWSDSPVTQSGILGGAQSTGGAEVPDTGNDIILSPFQLSGVLRALNEGNLVTQKSNPVVITEDNEKASISLIDRIPIITQTSTISNGVQQTTEEVRYTIDQGDSTEPDTTREIGVTMTMTPSLLPDGTIRMHMRPRNAQIVENIKTQSGNFYPRVSEATIQSIARIPNGYSLIIGGFYGELDSKNKNKVPLLGDIPVINFFFKSKQTKKERSSLIFVVTPTSYDPTSAASHQRTSQRVHNNMRVAPGSDWVDEHNPGPAHEPNVMRTIRGMRPAQAPYYPRR